MIDSVAAGILLEIVFGGRVSRRLRWSLNLDVRHQDSECIGIVLREMLAQDATDSFRYVVDCLSLDLCPNVRNESQHTEFGIDTLDFFADDQTVLCQIEKRALLFHVQMSSLFRRPVISARVKMITYPVEGCQLLVIGCPEPFSFKKLSDFTPFFDSSTYNPLYCVGWRGF